jgi:DNA-binding NtrC family response regulator
VGGEAKTVLVVDDEASLRLLCRVNLELDGFRVLEAATIVAARDVLETREVDVLLLDLHVSGRNDGLELLRELRDHEASIRAALVTGSVDLDTLDTSLADAVLTKPFAIDELTRIVRDLAGVRTRA